MTPPPTHTVPLSSFQGQTDQQKTMWEGSRETLETVDSRAENNKRIHDVNVGEIHGCYDCCPGVNQAQREVDGTNKFPALTRRRRRRRSG